MSIRIMGPAIGWVLVASLARAEIPSQWRDAGVTSDPQSWAGVPFELEAGLEIGAVNDADHLYVCLYPSNQRVQYQLIHGGATVWVLDEDGDKQGGVRFRPRRGEALPAPPVGPRDAPDPSELRERVERAMVEFDILDDGEDVVETRARESAGEVQLRIEASQHVYYVVRIPLAHGEARPLAVGAEPGATIGLGVETPRIERSPARAIPPDAEGGDPGERPPDPGRRFIPPEPIRFWTALSLAEKDESPAP